jgi:transcription elongation GreA/GreB family factor
MSQIELTPLEMAQLKAGTAKVERPPRVEADTGGQNVHTGSRVTLEDQFGDELEVTLSTAGGAGSVSPQSPVGTAVFGAAVGDRVTVLAPHGSWTALILAIA